MSHTLTRSRVFHLLLVCSACLITTVAANAQVSPQPTPDAASARASVIPQPRQMSITGDPFHAGRVMRIALADSRSEEDRFAAQDFANDVKETAAVTTTIGTGRRRRAILIGRTDVPIVQEALKRAGVELPARL